jgi:chaperonin GroEL (HSP60 family)
LTGYKPQQLVLQVLVELAELQDQEVGDGTTSVVIVAAELLKRANELVRNKIHPTSIISGYRLAMREVRNYQNTCYQNALCDLLMVFQVFMNGCTSCEWVD